MVNDPATGLAKVVNDPDTGLVKIVNDPNTGLAKLVGRMIAFGLLDNLIAKWEGILSAPLQELGCKNRIELLDTARPLKDLFDDFTKEHEISVPQEISDANDFLSDEGKWGGPLRKVFDKLSELRVSAGDFLAGTTPVQSEATGVARRNPARPRAKRT